MGIIRPHVSLSALLFLLACGSSPSGNPPIIADAADGHDDALVVPAEVGWEVALATVAQPTIDIDILFVVDDSRSNVSPQLSRLIGQGDPLLDALTEVLGGEPNLHVGVVTTDLGSAGYDVPGCIGDGTAGVLQNTPRIPGCTPPSGRYLVDVADAEGGRMRNYSGGFGAALACIGDVGRDGCGFEQPLEAMRRALDGSNAENAGFLRDNALLAVILVTDEDDCSVSDPAFFAPASGDDDPLGPLSAFRCWEQGVVCAPDTPREPGRYYDCRSREDSSYLPPVAEYRDFLRQLKPDPSMVYVHQVSGSFPWAEVALDGEGHPALVESCDVGETLPEWPAVVPAWRLHSFTRGFAGRGEETSLCQLFGSGTDWPMQVIGPRIGRVASGSTCLMGQLWDSDPNTAGIQPFCRAFDVTGLWTPTEARTPVPRCEDGPTGRPCFRLCETTSCDTDRAYHLRAELLRVEPPPVGASLLVECLHQNWASVP